MSDRRKLVDEAYVFEAMDFVEAHLSFFVAPLLRRDFSNWARMTPQRNNTMSAIDKMLRDVLEVDLIDNAEFFEIYKQLGLTFKAISDIAPSKIIDKLDVGSDARNENETTFEAYSKTLLNQPSNVGDHKAGLIYGQDYEFENFLQLRPYVVTALLYLKRSPVFHELYKEWQTSSKYRAICRQYNLQKKSEERIVAPNSFPLNDKAPQLTRETMNQQCLFGDDSNHKPFASSTSSKEPPFDPTDTAGCDDQQTTSPQDRSKEDRAGSSSDPTDSFTM